MQATWLSTTQVAALTGQNDRTVRRKAKNGTYQARPVKSGRGKDGWEIALSSLPADVKAKHKSNLSNAAVREVRQLPHCTERQREVAFERFEILKKWEQHAKQRGVTLAAAVNDFIDRHQKENSQRISRGTLYRWQKDHKDRGLTGLVPGWKNPRRPFQEDGFSKQAQEYVADLWLHPGRPSMKLCFNYLKRKGQAEEWAVPGYTTVKKYLQAIPQAVKVRRREGQKVFENTVVPSLIREYNIDPMAIVESDHHQLDIATLMPDGKVIFPWLTLWMDVRTRKPLAWALVSRPNSDSIQLSLRELIIKYGVPFAVHLDNGKDYRAKIFTGGKKRFRFEDKSFNMQLDQTYLEGIYSDLGIKTHWAIPYNAKSKVIERFFKTLRTEFSLHFRGYRGQNVSQRPEVLLKNMKTGNVTDIETLKTALHSYIDYTYSETRTHRGKGMDNQTPNHVFYALMKTKRAVREEELVLLCSQAPKPQKVNQQGIWLFNGWYWNETIHSNYLGQKVRLRFTEEDISMVYVFTLEGRFIGIARRRIDAEWGMEGKDYEKHMRMKKAIRESAKEWESGNIQQRISDIEREMMVLEDEAFSFQERELVSEFFTTKYSYIIQELQRQERSETQAQSHQGEVTKKFAAMKEKPAQTKEELPKLGTLQKKHPSIKNADTRVDDGVDQFIKSYGRKRHDDKY